MNINIVCVGKIKEKYLKLGIDEFKKRLSKYCKLDVIELDDEKAPENLSDKEKKALKITNLTVLAMLIGIVVVVMLPNSPLRNVAIEQEQGFMASIIDHSPLMNGFVLLIAIIFFVAACVYGKVSGQFKNEKDIGAEWLQWEVI